MSAELPEPLVLPPHRLPHMPAPFVYNARHDRTVDGDSIEVYVDRGMRDYSRWIIRIAGINAREISMEGGREAREHLDGLIRGQLLVLTTVRPDKYGGRYLASVSAILATGQVDVGTELVREGWAMPWSGRGKAPVPAWPPVPDPKAMPEIRGVVISVRGLMTDAERAAWP